VVWKAKEIHRNAMRERERERGGEEGNEEAASSE